MDGVKAMLAGLDKELVERHIKRACSGHTA